jgi:hypothetical protein
MPRKITIIMHRDLKKTMEQVQFAVNKGLDATTLRNILMVNTILIINL